MPPTDYKQIADHGKHAVVVAGPLVFWLRSLWYRIRRKESVVGYRVQGYK